MKGFGGLTEAIDSLLSSAGLSLPPWAIPAVLVLAFGLLLPHIRQNQRTHRARILIRERSEHGGGHPTSFHDELIALANDHAVTLSVIAHEAHKYGFLTLAKRAYQELRRVGADPTELHKLHRTLYGPPPVHPEAEYAAIELQLEQGLNELAAKRINSALAHWPHDARLQKYAETLGAEE